MLSYDESEFHPPAPVATLRLNVYRSKSEKASEEAEFLFDSGADISCIPSELVARLARSLNFTNLPYRFVNIEGFSGNISSRRAYILEIESNELTGSHEVEFIESFTSLGILGRDVANKYNIFLNGPQKKWGRL